MAVEEGRGLLLALNLRQSLHEGNHLSELLKMLISQDTGTDRSVAACDIGYRLAAGDHKRPSERDMEYRPRVGRYGAREAAVQLLQTLCLCLRRVLSPLSCLLQLRTVLVGS